MLVEFPAASLLAGSAEQSVADVIEACLGQRPTPAFMQRHAARIGRDEIGFLMDYLGQWPRRLRSTLRRQRTGAAAMQDMDKIISTHFLMMVPNEMFLALAYREFFDRQIDESGMQAYGHLDFADQAQREHVIAVLSQSEEFRQQATPRVLAGPPSLLERLGTETPQGLYWDRKAAVDKRWFAAPSNPKPISSSYTPIILWVPGRDRLYTYPGVEFNGPVGRNVLTAHPEWVLWGPKAPVVSGSYKVLVDMVKAHTDLCIFDVCTDGGMTKLFSIEFFASLKLEIPLHIDADAGDLEFRLFNLSGRKLDIELNEISLSRIQM